MRVACRMPEGSLRQRDADRRTSPRSRLLHAVDLLHAHRRGGAHDRAHRDGGEGDARRVLRRDDPDRPRDGDVAPGGPGRARHDTRATPRPDPGRARAGPPVEPRGEVTPGRPWRLLVTEPCDGATNMAIDE